MNNRHRRAKRSLVAAAMALSGWAAMTAVAYADSTGSNFPVPEERDALFVGTNLMWIIIGAALVIFMQAGFALVETGFCRAKHARARGGRPTSPSSASGFVAYFLVGYSLHVRRATRCALIGLDAPAGGAA